LPFNARAQKNVNAFACFSEKNNFTFGPARKSRFSAFKINVNQKNLLAMKTFLKPVLVAALLLPFASLCAQTAGPTKDKNKGQLLKVAHASGTKTFDRNGAERAASPLTLANGNTRPSISWDLGTISTMTFDFQSLDPHGTVPNLDCPADGSSNIECGWYRAFWIFGDGNYKKFEDSGRGNYQSRDAESLNVTYSYGRSGTYEPVVYLTERYHNNKKPDAARAKIKFDLTPATPPSDPDQPVLLNNTTRKAAIDFNHVPCFGYHTAMALAFRKDLGVNKVMFFYNGLGQGSQIQPVKVMEYQETETPSYYNGGLNRQEFDTVGQNLSFLNYAPFIRNLPSKFKSYVDYDISTQSTTVPTDRQEMRLFPIMQTLEQVSGWTRADSVTAVMALLLGPDSLSNTADRQNARDALQGLFGDVNLQLSQNLSAIQDDGFTTHYVRGVVLQPMRLALSHDPNNLFVTDIRELGNGQYRAFFRLKIFNEGDGPETSPSLNFRDLTGGHYATRPVLVGMPNSVTQTWTKIGRIDRVNLEDFLIRQKINGIPGSNTVYFYIDTDMAGIQKLYQETPRALEVCVEFSMGAGDCSDNDYLLAGSYQNPNGGYRGIDGGGTTTTCNWMPWLVGLLALIILLFVLWWFRNQPNA
jgi:hypothetical protein